MSRALPRRGRNAILATVVALFGLAATVALFYPGLLSNDAIEMYRQVETGRPTDVKPPLFVLTWRVADRTVCGSGGIFTLHTVFYWCGVLLVALAAARSPIARAALVLGIGLLPPLVGRLPMVSVDQALVASWLLGVGLLLARDAGGERRAALTLAAFAVLTYGALMRYNSFAALLPLFWLLAAPAESAAPAPRPGRLRRWAIALALTLGVALGSQALNRWVAEPTRIWTLGPLWDLAAISMRSGEMVLPAYVLRDGEAAHDVGALRDFYSEWSANSLLWKGGGFAVVPPSAEASRRLGRDWLAAIARHPLDYLRHRGLVARHLLMLDGVPDNAVYPDHPPVAAAIDDCAGILPTRFASSTATRLLGRTLRSLRRTPLYATWLWTLAAVIIAGVPAVAGSRGRAARALAWSGLLYVAPLAVLAPSIEFRYTLWLYAATAAAAVLTVASRSSARAPGAAGTPIGPKTR